MKTLKNSTNHELLILIALKLYIIVIFVQGSCYDALVILRYHTMSKIEDIY
jgi:hypothetical protein